MLILLSLSLSLPLSLSLRVASISIGVHRSGDCIEYSFLRIDIEESPPVWERSAPTHWHEKLDPKAAKIAAACATAAKKYSVVTEVTWGALPQASFGLITRGGLTDESGTVVIDTRRKWSLARCNEYV